MIADEFNLSDEELKKTVEPITMKALQEDLELSVRRHIKERKPETAQLVIHALRRLDVKRAKA